MRRYLLYFALLAVALVGLGTGGSALRQVWQTTQASTPGRDPAPRHCHCSPTLPPVTTEPRTLAVRDQGPLPRKEPSPCPGFALQTIPAAAPRVAMTFSHPAGDLPVGIPPPLARACVLRI